MKTIFLKSLETRKRLNETTTNKKSRIYILSFQRRYKVEAVQTILTLLGIAIVVGIIDKAIEKFNNATMGKRLSKKEYEKAIAESTGYEKFRLANRKIFYAFRPETTKDKDGILTCLHLVISEAYIYLNDIFFSTIQQMTGSSKNDEMINDIVKEMQENKQQAEYVAAGTFGIALGIVILKLSATTDTLIDEKLRKEFIDSLETSQTCKRKIDKISKALIKYITNKKHNVISGLGPLAYEMMGLSLDDTNQPDPMLAMALNIAVSTTAGQIDITSFVSSLEKRKIK